MGMKVLVIDDFENVRKSIRAMLIKLGVDQVTEAINGKNALRAFEGDKFDVVLCDFNLGKGLDGQQLLEHLRENKMISYLTTYVMITAETAKEMVMGALEHQPDDYLAKPFAFDTLGTRWKRWMERIEILAPVLKAMDKDDAEAILKECKLLIKSQPRYRGWAQKTMCDILIRKRQISTVSKILEDILKTRPLPWAEVYMARVCIARKQFDKARMLLEKVIRANPDFIIAYDYLAQTYAGKGERKNQLDTLKRGVYVSPRNYERQKSLAEVGEVEGDYSASRKAFRSVISLSEYSAKEDPTVYQRLLNVTGMLADTADDEAIRKRAISDVNATITKMTKKYPENQEIKTSARIFSAMNMARTNPDKAPSPAEVKKMFQEYIGKAHSYSRDLGYYMARYLYQNNLFGDGDLLVDKLRDHPKTDQGYEQRLDQLQNEPVSEESRELAAQLNRRGRGYYEQGDFESALKTFKEALQYSPRSPALVLNYTQCAIQYLQAGNNDGVTNMKEVEEKLSRLSYLRKKHAQYDRYMKIKLHLGLGVS